MALVVDASVALKWVMLEDGSDSARRLLAQEILVAPDLLFVECANVLWVKARRGVITADQAKLALAAIEATPIRSVPSRALSAQALLIASELQATAYDSLYLAAALAERIDLVTADQAFAQAAHAHAGYAASVRLLGNSSP